MTEEPVYWLSPVGERDDFGDKIKDEIFDAPTIHGPWALMTFDSWVKYAKSKKLGVGLGQRYVKQPDGRFLKVNGLD